MIVLEWTIVLDESRESNLMTLTIVIEEPIEDIYKSDSYLRYIYI